MDTPTWVEEYRDDLEILAASDLRVSVYAQTILEHYESHSSDSIEEADRTDTNPIEESQNRSEEHSIEPEKPSEEEPKGSIFAY